MRVDYLNEGYMLEGGGGAFLDNLILYLRKDIEGLVKITKTSNY